MPINSIHFSGQVSHLTWKLKLNGFFGGQLENLNKFKNKKFFIFRGASRGAARSRPLNVMPCDTLL